MFLDTIDRNADHLGAALGPFIGQLCNSTEFGGADGCEILGVREENRPRVADPVVEGDLALIRFGSEIGNNVVDAQTHGGSPILGLVNSLLYSYAVSPRFYTPPVLRVSDHNDRVSRIQIKWPVWPEANREGNAMIEKRQFYINGKWVDPIAGKDHQVIDPSTEEAVAVISLGGKADTDAAVAAAKAALPGWMATPKEERIALVEKLVDIYKARGGEMAELISMEMGAPRLIWRNRRNGGVRAMVI